MMFAAILVTFLVCSASALAIASDATSEALNGSPPDYEWQYEYMNTSWWIQLHAHDVDGIESLWWSWDGGSSISTGYSGVGGSAADVYRNIFIESNRTTHADDGLQKLWTATRGWTSTS